MNNVTEIKHKSNSHQQACEWISRIDRGLSEQEQTELVQWSQAHPSHQKLLFDVAELWDDLSSLNELSGLFPLRNHPQPDRNDTAFKPNWRTVGWAASFALLISLTTLLFPFQENETDFVVETRQAETALGEQKPVTLEDGSVVHLNTNSLIKITYSQRQRSISLVRGEAHFDVAHDPSRPFVVTAGKNTVTAVGTAFNIELDQKGQAELLVTEGKVMVRDRGTDAQVTSPSQHFLPSEGILLVSGQKATMRGDIKQTTDIALEQVQRDLAWQQGMLVFEGEMLVDALAEVSRYAPVKFEVTDDRIRNTRVAGYFKVGDIKGLLFALKNSFDIEYTRTAKDTYQLNASHKS